MHSYIWDSSAWCAAPCGCFSSAWGGLWLCEPAEWFIINKVAWSEGGEDVSHAGSGQVKWIKPSNGHPQMNWPHPTMAWCFNTTREELSATRESRMEKMAHWFAASEELAGQRFTYLNRWRYVCVNLSLLQQCGNQLKKLPLSEKGMGAYVSIIRCHTAQAALQSLRQGGSDQSYNLGSRRGFKPEVGLYFRRC